jgi:hypothetical protein
MNVSLSICLSMSYWCIYLIGKLQGISTQDHIMQIIALKKQNKIL